MRAWTLLVPWVAAVVASSGVVERDLASTILTDLKGVGGCAGCKVRGIPSLTSPDAQPRQAVLGLLKLVDKFGDSAFVSALTEICDISGVSLVSSRSVSKPVRKRTK